MLKSNKNEAYLPPKISKINRDEVTIQVQDGPIFGESLARRLN